MLVKRTYLKDGKTTVESLKMPDNTIIAHQIELFGAYECEYGHYERDIQAGGKKYENRLPYGDRSSRLTA